MTATDGGGDEDALDGDFWVRFWGVRGSLPCPDPASARYGGNTACLEIRCGERTLVFDMGSGASYLGRDLLARAIHDFDIFLTHAHLDHVMGLPFFEPFYRDYVTTRLWSGPLENVTSTRALIGDLMREPFVPITPDIFTATLSYLDFDAGDTLTPHPGIEIVTAALNHPGGATGYRVDFAGRSICYVSDTEHLPGMLDPSVLGLIEGADIVIYDATYTDNEYLPCKGFGHSTWRHGARLCDVAGVGRYVPFHHHTEHNDDFMDALAEQLNQVRPASVVAREGMILAP